MPSAKLPRGAEYSYYGGVETKFPYVIFIPIVAFPLDLIFPPGSHQTGLARLLTVGSCTVLLAALFLNIPPAAQGGKARQDRSTRLSKGVPFAALGSRSLWRVSRLYSCRR